jgi:hypothetical protein
MACRPGGCLGDGPGQYTIRGDLLEVIMAQYSDDPEAKARGRLTQQTVSRRVVAWRRAGLIRSGALEANRPWSVWLTADGMQAAGLP